MKFKVLDEVKRETHEVFYKDIDNIIDKINEYWYNYENKPQSVKILKKVLKRFTSYYDRKKFVK